MNDYFSRNDLSPADRAVTRAVSAASAVQPISAHKQASERDGAGSRKPTVKNHSVTPLDDEMVSAAEYANVHARIADILADLKAETGGPSVEGAEAAIQSMFLAPIILVPLPPASKEAIESTVLLAKRIAAQTSCAHAAQAHVRRGTADQILSTVA